MRRWLALGAAGGLLIIAGLLWFSAPRPTQPGLQPLAGAARAAAPSPGALPDPPLVAPVSDVTPADREARRFARYDKDKDGMVSREEYLAIRRKTFAKQDVDGNGVLSFEEAAVKTIARFEEADEDDDRSLDAGEFAATAPRRKSKAACPPPAREEADG